MAPFSYRRHRFPAGIVQHAIWLYLRFTLSYREVEEVLAGRGLDVSYETVRRWVLKFGPLIARKLRRNSCPMNFGGDYLASAYQPTIRARPARGVAASGHNSAERQTIVDIRR
jgi:hypothetical protein